MSTEVIKPKVRRGPKNKPENQKAQNVQIYVTGEEIENAGGIEKAREIAKAAIIYNGLVQKEKK